MLKKIEGTDWDFLKTSALFLIIATILGAVVSLLFRAGQIYFLINATTSAAAFFIGLVGIGARSSPNEIYLDTRILVITLECTAVFIVVLYTSLIIAYPTPLKKKLSGLAIGIPLIFIVNVARLVFIAAVSEKLPTYYFNFVHDYLWQVGFILLITMLWLTFIREKQDEA
ncbi:MAG: archaeosortase/exosortase family protein [Actinomycetota bacterium]|nr:archaeosortase/exosortase family protein [Actinomycetota bacterium]